MAFIRAKNIKGKTYYYLVENKREGDKVKQTVLKYLGTSKPDKLGTTEPEYKKIGSGLVGDVYEYDKNHIIKIIKKRPMDRHGNVINRQLMIDNERRAILYDEGKSENNRLFPTTKEIKKGEFKKERLYEIKNFENIKQSEKIRFGGVLTKMLRDGYGLYDEVQTMKSKDGKIKVSDADGFIYIKNENEKFKNSMSYKVNTFISKELKIGEWITKFPTINKTIDAFEDGVKETRKKKVSGSI